MAGQITHYSILDIPDTATQEEIRAAFTHLMSTRDEKEAPSDPLAHKRLVYAYKVLSNKRSRMAYDKQLQSQPRQPHANDAFVVQMTFSRTELVITDSPQLLYALLEITAVDRSNDVALPLNICIVIDRSTSMAGARIERVKAALRDLVDMLAPDDMISIISFSDRAQIVHPNGRVTNKASIMTKVHRIQTSGGTEIYQGLSAGVQQIKQANLAKYNNQIILLTDGHTYGDADSCLNLAEKVARANIEITAFGLGTEWNDQFLDTLVTPSGGRSIYINRPDEIVTHMQKSVEGLGNIYARNICLTPKFVDGVVLRNVFKLMPFAQPVPHHDKEIRLGHLETRLPLTMLIELEIAPQLKEVVIPFSIELTAEISHQNKQNYTQNEQYDLAVQANATETDPPPELLKAVRLFNLYQMNEKAWSEAEAGQFDMATARMQHISTRLLEAGEEELSQQAFAETQRLATMETVSIEGRKDLKYGTRALMQQFSNEG